MKYRKNERAFQTRRFGACNDATATVADRRNDKNNENFKVRRIRESWTSSRKVNCWRTSVRIRYTDAMYGIL